MEIAFDSRFCRGAVEHPPICYAQDGVWLRRAGQACQQLYSANQQSNCPLAWSPGGEYVYYANMDEILALDLEGVGKTRLWKGREHVMWLLQSCAKTGRLLFRSGNRLVLLERDGRERTLFQGEIFTLDATLSASRAVLWIEEELVSIDLSTGSTTTLLSDPPTDFSISPDGQKIALAEGRLRVWSEDQTKLVSSAPEAAAPAFSPDSRCVAFQNGDYELWRVDMEGSDLVRLAWVADPVVPVAKRRGSYASSPGWSSDGRFLVAQLTHATGCPTRADTRIEFASVILDFQESRVEVWPGYHDHATFRPGEAL